MPPRSATVYDESYICHVAPCQPSPPESKRRTLYSDVEDDEVQLTNTYKFDEGSVLAFDDDGASFEGAEVEKLTETRIETQDILTTTLGAEHRLGSGFTIDYSAGYAVASEENTNDFGAAFVGEDLAVGYDLSNRKKPRLYADGDDYFDPANFALDEAAESYSKVEEKERTLALNLRRDDTLFSIPGYWKIGAKLRARSKSANTDETVYDGFGEDYTLADFTPYDVDYPLGAWGPPPTAIRCAASSTPIAACSKSTRTTATSPAVAKTTNWTRMSMPATPCSTWISASCA